MPARVGKWRSPIDIQVDRRGAADASKGVLAQVPEERLPEGAVALEGAVAERCQDILGIADAMLGHQQVEVVVLAMGQIAMEREGQGWPLEGGEGNPPVIQGRRHAAQFARQGQRSHEVLLPENLLRALFGLRDVLPGQVVQAPEELGPHAVTQGKCGQERIVDRSAKQVPDERQVRFRPGRLAEQVEFSAAHGNGLHLQP